MAALAPGILLKLINGIHSGIKPTGEHRSALLQVTDIVPVDVDQKDLWPTHGFYVKISDSSHSIYATLPYEQDELILSNKIQLGQFIYVDRLEPGSPVPIIKGAKPLPGRHALVGTPEPITRIKSNGQKMDIEKLPSHTRGSWSQDQNATELVSSPYIVKPIALDFDRGTPIKDTNGSTRKGMIPASPMVRGRLNKDIGIRSSASGFIPKMADLKSESPNVLRKSCVGPPSASKIPRSKSVCERDQRMPQTPINSSEKKSTTPPPRLRSARTEVSFSLPEDDSKPTNSSSALRLRFQSHRITSTHNTYQSMPMNDATTSCFATAATLPGKLNMISKEVIQQRETTQKVALQALRDASASEILVRVLKMFTELSKNAKPETPAPCLNEFLSFHQEIAQAVRDMESVQAATSVLLETVREPEHGASVLNEIAHNSIDQQGCPSLSTSKRRTAVSKSPSIGFDRSDNGSRSSTNCKKAGDRKVHNECESICGQNQASNYRTFTNAIRLGKQIETEAGNWFMEFLEASLETGLKKPRGSATTFLRKASTCCPQPLILKVINWIEVEQSDASKRPVHHRAAHIARKLRIKAKNP